MIRSLRNVMRKLFRDQEFCTACDDMVDVINERYEFIECGPYFVTADITVCAGCGQLIDEKSSLITGE